MPSGVGTRAYFPLPAVPVPPRPSAPSPRSRQRHHYAVSIAVLANFLIVCLNYLSVSFASAWHRQFDADVL